MSGLSVWYDQIGERWDLKGAQAAIFKAHRSDFVPFGTFVEERTVLVRPFEDPEKEWPIYGVSNKEGVFLSHPAQGSDCAGISSRRDPTGFQKRKPLRQTTRSRIVPARLEVGGAAQLG